MSKAARARTSQASSSPPADAVAGLVPPAASTVVINASQLPRYSSRSRSIAQRGGEDRYANAAGRIDSVGERLHVRGVSGGVLSAIEQDADAWSGRSTGNGAAAPPDRLLDRRLEADTGQQHGVAEKRAAGGDCPARRGPGRRGHRRRPHRNGRQLHQRGVRACSPPSTTIGLPVPRNRSKPLHSSCGEPSTRAPRSGHRPPAPRELGVR